MAKEKLVKKTIDTYTGESDITSPLKAIRQYCKVWCMNNSSNEVDLCTTTDCQLYKFRYGKNPHNNRDYSKNISNLAAKRSSQSSFSGQAVSSEEN